MLSWRSLASAVDMIAGYRRGRQAVRRLCGDDAGATLAAYARLVWGVPDEADPQLTDLAPSPAAAPPGRRFVEDARRMTAAERTRGR